MGYDVSIPLTDGGDDREYLIKACLARRRAVTLCAKYQLGAVAESG